MAQFSATACPTSFRLCLILATTLLFLGCRREEISTYSAPKDSVPAPRPSPAAIPQQGGTQAAPVQWTVPAGWEQQPASGMRVGSFAVNKDGQRADVSIIPLAGISGSELDNVNRWRGQVGLPPVDAAKLAETAEKVNI